VRNDVIRVPLVLLVIAIILIPAVIALCVPISIVQRYRTGTAKRPARVWVAGANTILVGVSVGTFLVTAGITNVWIPGAWHHSVLGLFAGLVVGAISVYLSRWEVSPRQLSYTANRWLILSITVLVAARIAYGVWRAWHAWHTTPEDRSWLAEAGLSGSMAIGALLLGYYFAFWAGIWLRASRHRRVLQSQIGGERGR
jgi:hypothetical protein